MKYKKGSIGYAMKHGEQEGKDAWLGGLKRNDNPHTSDKLSRIFWDLGWNLANEEYRSNQRRKP